MEPKLSVRSDGRVLVVGEPDTRTTADSFVNASAPVTTIRAGQSIPAGTALPRDDGSTFVPNRHQRRAIERKAIARKRAEQRKGRR